MTKSEPIHIELRRWSQWPWASVSYTIHYIYCFLVYFWRPNENAQCPCQQDWLTWRSGNSTSEFFAFPHIRFVYTTIYICVCVSITIFYVHHLAHLTYFFSLFIFGIIFFNFRSTVRSEKRSRRIQLRRSSGREATRPRLAILRVWQTFWDQTQSYKGW